MDSDKAKPSKGYDKRPLWQWIALYVVLGAVVYFLIYWFVLRGSGTTVPGLYNY